MTTPFLPETSGQTVRSPKEAGSWEYNGTLLDKLADDLSVGGASTADVLTAVPTVWARPLLFAEALFSDDHPLNREVTGEWRGFLSLICFRDIYKFQISVERYTLSSNSPERLGRVLQLLQPDQHCQTSYLIYVNNVLVGASFPKSLFFTAADCRTTGYCAEVPWLDRKTNRLTDPAGNCVPEG